MRQEAFISNILLPGILQLGAPAAAAAESVLSSADGLKLLWIHGCSVRASLSAISHAAACNFHSPENQVHILLDIPYTVLGSVPRNSIQRLDKASQMSQGFKVHSTEITVRSGRLCYQVGLNHNYCNIGLRW